MPHADPEVRRAYHKAWKERHRQEQLEYQRLYYVNNRDRLSTYRKDWHAKRVQRDPEGYRARQRKLRLAREYEITPEQYEALALAQNGVCAICGAHPVEVGVLHVDHNHATGAVRGLLCSRCNQGVGYFRDSPRLLKRAAAYLRQAEAASKQRDLFSVLDEQEGAADAGG